MDTKLGALRGDLEAESSSQAGRMQELDQKLAATREEVTSSMQQSKEEILELVQNAAHDGGAARHQLQARDTRATWCSLPPLIQLIRAGLMPVCATDALNAVTHFHMYHRPVCFGRRRI